MREGWESVKLGDVATRRTDFTSVVADEHYRIVGVQRSGWGLKLADPVRGDSMKFSKLMKLAPGDLVYRTITAFEAPSTVAPESTDELFVTPQTFPVYRLNATRISPGFMALLTTFPSFHREMAERCVGTVLRRKTLSKSAFESIPLELPPLAEQRRIVDLIGAVDDAIEAAEAEGEAAEVSTEQLVASLTLREGVVYQPLGTLGSLQLGKMLSKKQNRGEPGKYLRNINVQWGRIDADDLLEMPFTPEDHRKFALEIGDVLICEGGAVGRSAMVAENLTGVLYQKAIHRFRSHGDLPSRYLVHFMKYAVKSGRISDYVTGTTIKHLPAEKLKTLPIPILNATELEELDSVLERGDGLSQAARAHAVALRELRANLLTALLSGAHEIPESYDRFLKGEAA